MNNFVTEQMGENNSIALINMIAIAEFFLNLAFFIMALKYCHLSDRKVLERLKKMGKAVEIVVYVV